MMSTIAATTATATTSSNSPTCETHDVSFTGYFPDPLRIFYLVWVDRAFNGFLIPLLGLIVFPMRPCSTSLPTTRSAGA